MTRATRVVRIALAVSAILVFALGTSWLLDQKTCADCSEWLRMENIGRVTLQPNSSVALSFHYDGPDKDYQRMMDEIWVAQMFYHELTPALLEDRHLIVYLRTVPQDSAEFRGLTMCVADHLELKTTNATAHDVATCLMKVDGVKEADILIPISQSAYQPHYRRFPDLKYLEFFVVLENPTLRSVNVTYDLHDVVVVRTPYDYVSILPNLTIMSIGILLMLAATALSLPAYARFVLSKLSEYLPHDVGEVVLRNYGRIAKWCLSLTLLIFIVPLLEIWGVIYRVGLWAPLIRLVEGDVYPRFLMNHDYVDYLLVTEGDFVARAHIVKGFLDLSLALFPLHVGMLALAMGGSIAYLRRMKVNRIVKVRSYGTIIISLSFVLLSPILLLLTLGSELARNILASSPAALALDTSSFDKLRSLVFNGAW